VTQIVSCYSWDDKTRSLAALPHHHIILVWLAGLVCTVRCQHRLTRPMGWLSKEEQLLHVKNLTQDCEVVTQGGVADTFWTRFKGLMGVRDFPAGDGMLITPCNSVHCMFMSIPIDVLYLNRADQVVAIDHDLKPWRIGSIHRGVHHVVELPAGTAAATATEVGDRLEVKR
jgi:uncharacterized protein